MVKTYGLTHINLAVQDLDRALLFYEQVFGVKEYWRDERTVHMKTPGWHDVITFEQKPEGAGTTGGIAHFGFRLVDPNEIDRAVEEAVRAGGKLLRRGRNARMAPEGRAPARGFHNSAGLSPEMPFG